MPRSLWSFLLFLLLAVLPAKAQEANPNIRFGMPAPANAENREAFLISRPQYTLSYNAKTRTPNWVSWRRVAQRVRRRSRAANTT